MKKMIFIILLSIFSGSLVGCKNDIVPENLKIRKLRHVVESNLEFIVELQAEYEYCENRESNSSESKCDGIEFGIEFYRFINRRIYELGEDSFRGYRDSTIPHIALRYMEWDNLLSFEEDLSVKQAASLKSTAQTRFGINSPEVKDAYFGAILWKITTIVNYYNTTRGQLDSLLVVLDELEKEAPNLQNVILKVRTNVNRKINNGIFLK
jgi:hypothetical protein